MIKNYLKIAWRNLLKNKASSVINIGGLAVGMAVAMLIGLWIWDELSFNKYHKNYDSIAQVMQNMTYNGEVNTENAIPIILGTELHKNYRDNFKYIVMSSFGYTHILSFGDKKVSRTGYFMENDAPKMLSLKMVKGTDEGLN